MSISNDYPVKFSNSSTKPIVGVLFASDDENSDPSTVWAVFKDRNSTLTISSGTQMKLECYDANGERILLGPFDCKQEKSWILHSKPSQNEESLVLEHSVSDTAAEESKMITIDLSSVGDDIDGRVYLYKDDRIFLIKTLKGDRVTIPESPLLYFGLTNQDISVGDTFTNRKLFSSLALVDQSYYNTGMIIEVSDSPARRPHVTILKL